MCIGRLKCGAVLCGGLTYVLGIRAVRLRRNWPRARRSKSRAAFREIRREDLRNGSRRIPRRTTVDRFFPDSFPRKSPDLRRFRKRGPIDKKNV